MGIVNNKRSLYDERKLLRNNPTNEEAILWDELKKGKLEGVKFRRQHSIENFILDFYAPSIKLAIEIDMVKQDEERDRALNLIEILVLRIKNEEINDDLMAVLQKLIDTVTELKSPSFKKVNE